MSKRKRIFSIIALFLLACVCVGAFVMARQAASRVMVCEGVEKKTYEGEDYLIFRKKYSGEYDIQYQRLSNVDLWSMDACTQMDYKQYQDYCKTFHLTQKYTDPDKYYLIYSRLPDEPEYEIHAKLAAVEYCGDAAELYIHHEDVLTDHLSAFVCVVPTDVKVQTVQVIPLLSGREFKNIKKYGTPYNPNTPVAAKPIIYLYPEQETDVTVTLGHPECITHSYPKYDGPWRVTARPAGTLTDLETGRELYSLYYENVSPIPLPQTDEGFVVRGEDTAAFLEEKLALLGLSPREAEEFIVYWLPRLEENEWNYIRFASGAEIDAEMPLEITPQPDSMIRVLMLWKPLDAPIEVREQTLTNPPRTGFTSVEWGGAELTK